MRLFADHDVYAVTIHFVRSLGHDVEAASDAGLAQAGDEEILEHCLDSARSLVTRDKDFGALVFHRGLPSVGVVLIRSGPGSLEGAHRQLAAALARSGDLDRVFIVVEPSRFRIRHTRAR